MKRLNKKGFTLIELLAVIIILAVLSLIAIPAIMGRVTKAKRDTFITQGKTLIEAAQTEYATSDASGTWCISIADIKLDRGNATVSPITNGYLHGYVKGVYNSSNETMTWTAYIDDASNSAAVTNTSTSSNGFDENKQNYNYEITDNVCPGESAKPQSES